MDADVLIVGGGPVGLGLAIELGQRGIRCILSERYLQPQPIPKGQNLTQRTMEHLHFWGAEKELRSARTIPPDTQEFAINMSNMRHWDAPVKRYVDECLQGKEGPRGKDFNMRWVAAMVADVHRILSRGGVFMYPWDQREPNKPGKLRLLYEANPMSWLIEQAGGAATNTRQRILDIEPGNLHERVSVVLGSKNEVERITRYHD